MLQQLNEAKFERKSGIPRIGIDEAARNQGKCQQDAEEQQRTVFETFAGSYLDSINDPAGRQVEEYGN